MEPTRRLGSTSMRITPVGLGAWAIGGTGWEHAWGAQDDADSIATIRAAAGKGINWIDTAPVYGHGHSEEVVGRALAALPAADRPLVFTKCGLLWDDADPMAPQRRSGAGLRRQVEDSLRRLRVERIDLMQLHWPPEEGPTLEECWAELVALRKEGKIRAAGVSNFSVSQLESAERLGHVDTCQPPLSLLRRAAAAAEIPWCAAHDTGVIVYSPMESGLLSGAFTHERAAALPATDWRSHAPAFMGPALDRTLALVAAAREIADRHDVPVAAVAVAWTLAWPGVTGAVVGARHPTQLAAWLPAATLTLHHDDLTTLAAALRTHGLGTQSLVPGSAV